MKKSSIITVFVCSIVFIFCFSTIALADEQEIQTIEDNGTTYNLHDDESSMIIPLVINGEEQSASIGSIATLTVNFNKASGACMFTYTMNTGFLGQVIDQKITYQNMDTGEIYDGGDCSVLFHSTFLTTYSEYGPTWGQDADVKINVRLTLFAKDPALKQVAYSCSPTFRFN